MTDLQPQRSGEKRLEVTDRERHRGMTKTSDDRRNDGEDEVTILAAAMPLSTEKHERTRTNTNSRADG